MPLSLHALDILGAGKGIIHRLNWQTTVNRLQKRMERIIQRFPAARTEVVAMLSIAIPAIVDQVGMMSMGLVDTIMVGRLGSEELGAVGIGSAVYFFYAVFALSVVSSVSSNVAHAFGAGDDEEIAGSVVQGIWLALGLSAIGIALVWNAAPLFTLLRQPPGMIPKAETFIRALSFGMPASFCYAALRAFTSGLGRTRVTMVVSLCATALNAGLDYVLIYGKLGLPALGVRGAGMATAIVQWSMFGATLLYVIRARDLARYRRTGSLGPDRQLLGRLLRLGVPIGLATSVEIGVFGMAALLMGQIGTIALASHQIAINLAALTFMVPMGLSIAITTRVGQSAGRGDRAGTLLSGHVGIALAGCFMSCTALVFLLLPEPIVSIYTKDAAVISYASGLLAIGGVFQISDGIQAAAFGALRGLKDTTRPMVVNLLAYWLVGLSGGYLLAFVLGFGGKGLWWGLTAGLTVAAILHTLRFRSLLKG